MEAAKLDDVTFHTLLHTFASWAMLKDASLKELREPLGHSSLMMTMCYARLSPGRLDIAVSRPDGLTVVDTRLLRAQARAQEVPAEVDSGRVSANLPS